MSSTCWHFPNPGNGRYALELPVAIHISLLDAMGRRLLEKKLEAGKQELDLVNCAPGLYILKAKSGNRCGAVKLVKE